MSRIIRVVDDGDLQAVRDMLGEYLAWVVAEAKAHFDMDLDGQAALEYSLNDIAAYQSSRGRVLLAQEDEGPAGIAFMREIRGGVGEIKRMYVRPAFRGRKVGQSLLQQIIMDARDLGFSTLLLDSTQFMAPAHGLYRAAGFTDTDAYPEAEDHGEMTKYVIHMKYEL
ncbi:MAG: GNAT family N-acetyltransferase [Alphaproteobacteria bacterium]|nr:GNAT family N-acetyltransferase [Alphaproteobacteria bacterium]